MRRILTLLTTFLLTALVAAGCTGSDEQGDPEPTAPPTPASPAADDSPIATPSPDTTPEAALGASCSNGELGLTVSYPEDWTTNDGGVLPACSVFDPGPIDLEPGAEIPLDIAVTLEGSDRQFQTHAEATDQPGTRELERGETTVAGHDAVWMLLEATEDAPLLEPDTRLYRWVIDLGVDEMTAVSTLLATTYDEGEPSLEEKRRVLDSMVESLELDTPQ